MSGGRLVVLGDSILDVDLRGRSRRRCPDAPAPVLDEPGRWHRPGGAGLAAGLLHEYSGGDVVLVTAVGRDDGAVELARSLGSGVVLDGLPLRGRTPTKIRVQDGGTTVARLDEGCEQVVPEVSADEVRRALHGAGAVLVSDYGLGLTHSTAVREVLTGVARHTPVVWDPHPRGAPPVPGALLVTPNAAESLVPAGADTAHTLRRARRLADRWQAESVTVTLGDGGGVWADRSGNGGEVRAERVPEPEDTCGAGDAFAAACTVLLERGFDVGSAVEAGTCAAGRFVASGAATAYAEPRRERGPAVSMLNPPPEVEGARREGKRIVATGGCFDLLHAGHVDLLRRARALGDHLVVLVNDDASVRGLKGLERPVVPEHDRARLVGALSCVDTVVLFGESTPMSMLRRIRPDVWIKGGDHDADDLPEASVVRAAGGEVVTLPLLPGRSTTGLIDHLRGQDGLPAT